MLSKQYYTQFARMIRTQRHQNEISRKQLPLVKETIDGMELQLDRLVAEMVTMFAVDNPKFQPDRFITACQLPKETES